jgi:hypothetical protein
MQRASDTIAALAAALAKAQTDLENPEKSLTASIASSVAGAAAHSFRYASLASGLDLVRKSLGRQQIAVIQTTAIDQAAGIVRLTTTLAHASGEWLASEWPVCPVADMATPHRMGAALSYARRYALFTLVGIAGEDDLDQPDLAQDPAPRAPVSPASFASGDDGLFRAAPAQLGARTSSRARADRARPAVASSEGSASLRDQLLAQIEGVANEEELDAFTYQVWSKANALAGEDRERIQRAFQVTLERMRSASGGDAAPGADALPSTGAETPAASGQVTRIDEDVLALPEPRRLRDKQHLRFVAKQPCLVCGRRPSDPHHLRFAQTRGLGQKVSDEFTVPLCRAHHRELHRVGNEVDWWLRVGIKPLESARGLWTATHPNAAQSNEL